MNENFVYGFLFAVIVISGLLALQYGDNFNFLDSGGVSVLPSFGTALNWKTAICLSLFFGVFFKNMEGSVSLRLFNAFWILCLSWAFLDLFWILKAYMCGNYLFGSDVLSHIELRNLMIGLVRNSLMICISYLMAIDFLKFSWRSLSAFAVVVGYWIFMICSFPFSGCCFNTFIVYPVNFFPFLLGVKNWSELSWRKFLFA